MKKILLLIVLGSLAIISCNEILFHDEEGSRVLYFKDFNAVRIYGIYNLVLIQDSANRLDISGSNNINSITAYIRNDTLIIDNHKKISVNPHKNNLALHFSNLKHMVTYDPINVSNSDTIKADQFIYDASGEIVEARMVFDCDNLYFISFPYSLGFFHFSGKANSCVILNNYGSTVFADSLSCKNAEVVNRSVGDVYINASENILASIYGPGNIYYKGNPAIKIEEKRNNGRMIQVR